MSDRVKPNVREGIVCEDCTRPFHRDGSLARCGCRVRTDDGSIDVRYATREPSTPVVPVTGTRGYVDCEIIRIAEPGQTHVERLCRDWESSRIYQHDHQWTALTHSLRAAIEADHRAPAMTEGWERRWAFMTENFNEWVVDVGGAGHYLVRRADSEEGREA